MSLGTWKHYGVITIIANCFVITNVIMLLKAIIQKQIVRPHQWVAKPGPIQELARASTYFALASKLTRIT